MAQNRLIEALRNEMNSLRWRNKQVKGVTKFMLTTQLTAFRWPTKSLSHFQPFLSIICAVGPPEERKRVITSYFRDFCLWKFSPWILIVYLRSSHGLIPNISHRVTMIDVERALYRHIRRMAHWWPVHSPSLSCAICARCDHHFEMPEMCQTKMKIHISIYKMFNFDFNYWKSIHTGSQATPFTNPLWPFNVVIDCRLFIHQTMIVLSTLLLQSHPSCGDQARSRISAEMIHFCN